MKDFNNLQFVLNDEWELLGFLYNIRILPEDNILVSSEVDYKYIPATRIFNYRQQKERLDEYVSSQIHEENESVSLLFHRKHQNQFISGIIRSKSIYIWCKIIQNNKYEVDLVPEFTRLARTISSFVDQWILPRVDIPIDGLILTCFELYRTQGFYKRKLLSADRPVLQFGIEQRDDGFLVEVNVDKSENLFISSPPLGYIPWQLNFFIDDLISIPIYGLVPTEDFKFGTLSTIYYISSVIIP